MLLRTLLKSGEWFGMKGRSSQVIFANGVLTVADNGEAQDYNTKTEQMKAGEALINDWSPKQIVARRSSHEHSPAAGPQ